MEKKKLLLVAISVGVFLVLTIGAALLVFSPKNSNLPFETITGDTYPGTISVIPTSLYQSPIADSEQQPSSIDAVDLVRNPGGVPGLVSQPESASSQATTGRGAESVISVTQPTTAAVPSTPPTGRAANQSSPAVTVRPTQTTTPARTTTSPAQTTTSPAQTTTSPAQTTTSPAQTSTSPARTTTTPAQTTATPAQTTTSPAQTSTSPAQTTTTPAQTTATPAQTTTTPAQTTTTPAQTTTSPAQTSTSPTQTTASPTQTTASPAQTTAVQTIPAASTVNPTQTRVYDDYWVQTGAFSTIASAEGVKETLASKGITAIIENGNVNGRILFRVRVGPYTSQNEANYWLALIKSMDGFEDSQVRLTQNLR